MPSIDHRENSQTCCCCCWQTNEYRCHVGRWHRHSLLIRRSTSSPAYNASTCWTWTQRGRSGDASRCIGMRIQFGSSSTVSWREGHQADVWRDNANDACRRQQVCARNEGGNLVESESGCGGTRAAVVRRLGTPAVPIRSTLFEMN